MSNVEHTVSKTPKKRNWRRWIMVASAAVLATALCAVAACAPQTLSNTGEESAAEDEAMDVSSMGYSTFTERDTGYLIEDSYTTEFINAGSRGCNACHDDLWDVTVDLSPMLHLASTDPGYGYKASYLDCRGCHGGYALGGTKMAEAIHTAHMSSSLFVDDLDGNCFSCHAADVNGDMVIWEMYQNSPQFGSFKAASDPAVLQWLERRGWDTDTIAGITVQNDMPIEVTNLSQEISAQEDRFSACNYGVVEIDEAVWSLEITGVNNERSFTLEELKALPSVERNVLHECDANTIGSYQVCNIPVKGVLLSDVIEACGGLKDGTQSVNPIAEDEWGTGMYPIDWLLDNECILIYEEYGEPLSAINGFPVTFGVPGMAANAWTKWLVGIEFSPNEGMDVHAAFLEPADVVYPALEGDPLETYKARGGFYARPSVNSMWMNPVNNGDTLTLDENGKVELSGVAFGLHDNGTRLSQIAFSADYGVTWTMVDVPEDMDPYQWVNWSVDWTPEGPGVYTLYMSSVNSETGWQPYPSAITVNVE